MKRQIIIPILALTIGFASCSEEAAILVNPDDVTERIDIVLDGAEKEYIFEQSPQGESGDLIRIEESSPSTAVFRLTLDEDRDLIIRAYNETLTNLWEFTSQYSMFTPDGMDDKWSYVTVEIEEGGEVPSFTSHYGESYPQTIYVNVFRIESFDQATGEVHCRIVDLPLISADGDPNGSITINGTFRGIGGIDS